MIPILAKQAVNKKMEFKASKLLGAYEFFYAAGFLLGYMDLEMADGKNPAEIQEFIRGNSAIITGAKDDIVYLYDQFAKFQAADLVLPEDEDVLTGLFKEGFLDGGKRR